MFSAAFVLISANNHNGLKLHTVVCECLLQKNLTPRHQREKKVFSYFLDMFSICMFRICVCSYQVN